MGRLSMSRHGPSRPPRGITRASRVPGDGVLPSAVAVRGEHRWWCCRGSRPEPGHRVEAELLSSLTQIQQRFAEQPPGRTAYSSSPSTTAIPLLADDRCRGRGDVRGPLPSRQRHSGVDVRRPRATSRSPAVHGAGQAMTAPPPAERDGRPKDRLLVTTGSGGCRYSRAVRRAPCTSTIHRRRSRSRLTWEWRTRRRFWIGGRVVRGRLSLELVPYGPARLGRARADHQQLFPNTSIARPDGHRGLAADGQKKGVRIQSRPVVASPAARLDWVNTR